MDNLLQKANVIVEALDLDSVRNAGFERDPSVYEYIVTYPSAIAQKPIAQDEIFKDTRINDVEFYVHIPFCTGACGPCARYDKFVNPDQKTIEMYLDLLEKELLILTNVPELSDLIVNSVYFGGGTPTYLTVNQLKRKYAAVNGNLNFKEGYEAIVECSPETLNEEKRDLMQAVGITGVSIGIQSFNNTVLEFMNRRYNFEEALKSISMLEGHFEDLNIDLMAGLPYQELQTFKSDLELAVDSGATRITVYPTYVRPGCAFHRYFDPRFPLCRQEDFFPTVKENLLMQIMAKEFLTSKGFVEGPIHYFTKQGASPLKSLNRRWQGIPNIGIRVSTYQYAGNTQYHNFFDLKRYKAAIDAGKLPIWIGAKLDESEQIARAMIFGIKQGSVDLQSFQIKFKKSPLEIYPKILERLQKLKMIELNNNTIKLTYLGELFSEEIAIQFYSDAVKKAVGDKGYCCYSIQELPGL